MTEKRKPGWPFWTAVSLVAVLILYPLTIGPACLIIHRSGYVMVEAPLAYCPIGWAARRFRWIDGSLEWYIRLWVPDIAVVSIPASLFDESDYFAM